MRQTKYDPSYDDRRPWNAGKFVGAKRRLTPKQVWKLRFHLERDQRMRDLALFNIVIDSKLRGCDIIAIRIGDIVSSGQVKARAMVVQKKTGRPLRFELTEATRSSLTNWLERRGGTLANFVFPSRVEPDPLWPSCFVSRAQDRQGWVRSNIRLP